MDSCPHFLVYMQTWFVCCMWRRTFGNWAHRWSERAWRSWYARLSMRWQWEECSLKAMRSTGPSPNLMQRQAPDTRPSATVLSFTTLCTHPSYTSLTEEIQHFSGTLNTTVAPLETCDMNEALDRSLDALTRTLRNNTAAAVPAIALSKGYVPTVAHQGSERREDMHPHNMDTGKTASGMLQHGYNIWQHNQRPWYRPNFPSISRQCKIENPSTHWASPPRQRKNIS